MQLVVLFLISGSVRAVWKSAEDMHCIFVSTKGGFAWKFTYYDRYFFVYKSYLMYLVISQ